jgi:hypothetical protein
MSSTKLVIKEGRKRWRGTGTNARERWRKGRGVWGGRRERGTERVGGEEERRVGRRGEEIARMGPGQRRVRCRLRIALV